MILKSDIDYQEIIKIVGSKSYHGADIDDIINPWLARLNLRYGERGIDYSSVRAILDDLVDRKWLVCVSFSVGNKHIIKYYQKGTKVKIW